MQTEGLVSSCPSKNTTQLSPSANVPLTLTCPGGGGAPAVLTQGCGAGCAQCSSQSSWTPSWSPLGPAAERPLLGAAVGIGPARPALPLLCGVCA